MSYGLRADIFPHKPQGLLGPEHRAEGAAEGKAALPGGSWFRKHRDLLLASSGAASKPRPCPAEPGHSQSALVQNGEKGPNKYVFKCMREEKDTNQAASPGITHLYWMRWEGSAEGTP